MSLFGSSSPATGAPAPDANVKAAPAKRQQTAAEREEAQRVADQLRNRRRSTSREVNLKDRGGSTGRTITSLLGLNNLLTLGGSGSKAIADGQAPLAQDGGEHRMVAYEKDGLRIDFVCRRAADGSCTITAVFTNDLDATMTDLFFEAAVLKGVTLTVQPATSSTLPAHGGSASQAMSVVNQHAGEKGLAMKLRLSYSVSGRKVEDLGQVSSFPAGY
mmetsp:Transcript_51563/g.116038  ORF Transcript_51563/g.116038 Transcript_51563/m.116038 type:complete len:217 (-) Transcript_51563:58-708(-)